MQMETFYVEMDYPDALVRPDNLSFFFPVQGVLLNNHLRRPWLHSLTLKAGQPAQ